MIQLTRFRPYVQIVLWLVIPFVALNVALAALSATPVLAWLPQTTTGTGFLEDSRERVARVVDEYRERRVAPDDHLAVLIGISNMREAAELSVLRDQVGPGWRWLGVAGAVFGMSSFVQYADIVLESRLRPDIVVLGLGLHQVVDARAVTGARSRSGLAGALRRGDVRNVAVIVRNSSWVYSRQRDISVTVEGAVLALRARLFKGFGVALPLGESERLSPWREMVRMDWPNHFSAATVAAQEASLAEAGIFELETYQSAPVANASFIRIVESFRQQGSHVIVLLLPEASRLNTRVPGEALDLFTSRLRDAFGEDAPPILDYRRVIADEGFVDLPHLNRQGRMEFSRRLGGDIRAWLPSGKPLMASPVSSEENP